MTAVNLGMPANKFQLSQAIGVQLYKWQVTVATDYGYDE